MQTSGVTLWSSADGSQDAGVWQCTAGPSYWVQEENEFVHILSGSLTVTPDGGRRGSWARRRRGVPARLARTWDLHETVRKVYVIF